MHQFVPFARTLRWLMTVAAITLFALTLFQSCSKKDAPPPDKPKPTLGTASLVEGPFNTVVTITGSNFSTTLRDNRVYFNGIEATVTAVTANSLTVSVPKGAGTGLITASINGTLLSGPMFTYDYTTVVSTLAGSYFGSDDGTGTDAHFEFPCGMGIDGAGNLYVSMQLEGRIAKVTPGGVVTTIATGLSQPEGIAVDASGNIYVSETNKNRIVKIAPGGTVTIFAGSGQEGAQDGVGIAATFNTPVGLAIDGSGNLYVADASNNMIRKITPAGVVSTLAGNVMEGGGDGQGSAAGFSGPFAVAVNAAGTVFVADTYNNMIRKIKPDGTVTTIAGGKQQGSTDGTGRDARFDQPRGIAVDQSDNLYVTDFSRGLIRKITPTGVVTTIAGNSTQASIDGIGTAASFRGLFGAIMAPSGILYITDGGGNTVRKITFE
jgi:serine/threonine-protein kinase